MLLTNSVLYFDLCNGKSIAVRDNCCTFAMQTIICLINPKVSNDEKDVKNIARVVFSANSICYTHILR